MVEQIAQGLHGSPAEVITLILAAMPVSELRGAIPFAVLVGGMAWPTAYVLSVLGNLVPVPFLLLGLEPVSKWLRRWRTWDRFFDWLFARTRRRGGLVERNGALGGMHVVAIPRPVTRARTGSVAAFIFGVRPRLAFPAVIGGVLIAGVIVTLATLGVIGGVSLFTS